MKRKEKIKATWLSLMGMFRIPVSETIELCDDNYDTIARINCNPKDDDGIDAINLSKWLRNHIDFKIYDCEINILFKCNNNVTARISGNKKCETNQINLLEWLFKRTDTITNERELADVFSRTRHMVCKIDDTTLWRHSISGYRCGVRYIEKIMRVTKDDGRCVNIIIGRQRLSRF